MYFILGGMTTEWLAHPDKEASHPLKEAAYKRYSANPSATLPSMEELENRLKGRGTETDESFNKRFAIAKEEIKRACEYDYIVVNDSVSLCADKVCSIIEAETHKFSRMKALVDDMN